MILRSEDVYMEQSTNEIFIKGLYKVHQVDHERIFVFSENRQF